MSAGFALASVRRLFMVQNGGTPKTSVAEYWDGGIVWVTPEDLGSTQSTFISASRRTVSVAGVAESNATLVPRGSIILSTRAPIGYTAIAGVPLATNQGCKALVPLKPLESRFFRYQLSAASSELQSLGTGTTFNEMSSDSLKSFKLACPSLPIQRRIADFLDGEAERIDALIDKKRRLIDLLEEKRTATIAHAVTKGLDPTVPMKDSGIPWIGQIPAHWEEAHIVRLARLGSGHTPSRHHPEWWEDCTIPWITTGEVSQMRGDRIEYLTETRESISAIGLANSAAELHPKGTVVLSRTASAGFSAIMGVDMATSQDFVTWTCGPKLEPRFLLLCLRAMRRDLLERLAQGSTHQTIYMPDIVSIKIPVPPVEEQRAIVEWYWTRVEPIHAAIDKLNDQLGLLAEHREALITAAVTGEIDVETYAKAG